MTTHTETAWAIANPNGLYLGSMWRTQKEAITEFGLANQSWEQCEKEGDRAVRVAVTYEYPDDRDL